MFSKSLNSEMTIGDKYEDQQSSVNLDKKEVKSRFLSRLLYVFLIFLKHARWRSLWIVLSIFASYIVYYTLSHVQESVIVIQSSIFLLTVFTLVLIMLESNLALGGSTRTQIDKMEKSTERQISSFEAQTDSIVKSLQSVAERLDIIIKTEGDLRNFQQEAARWSQLNLEYQRQLENQEKLRMRPMIWMKIRLGGWGHLGQFECWILNKGGNGTGTVIYYSLGGKSEAPANSGSYEMNLKEVDINSPRMFNILHPEIFKFKNIQINIEISDQKGRRYRGMAILNLELEGNYVNVNLTEV